jgi:hypothetical protein
MTLRLTAAELRQLQGKPAANALTQLRALGRLPAGAMNKTEARYAAHLDTLKHLGLVLWWGFECVTFKLAPRTHYTPDFLVLVRLAPEDRPGADGEGRLECHEVKGYWQDDARVKVKVAAAMFPLPFKAIKAAKGGGWDVENF